MGGPILVLILVLLVALLLTPAIRARFGRNPPENRQDSPHEAVVRRLDDHRNRRSARPDDAGDSKS